MKILLLVKGLGEYSQAQAVAKQLAKQGEEITFLANNKFLFDVIRADLSNLHTFETEEELRSFLMATSADALFLCNSHTTMTYNLSRSPHIKKVFSLDSNWLFNNEIYPDYFQTYPWIDTCYVVFPQTFFESNLSSNGGYFDISSYFLKKIITPGFVPVGDKLTDDQKQDCKKKLGVKDSEKLILIYFGTNHFLPQSFIDLGSLAYNTVCEIIENISQKHKTSIKTINLTTENKIYLKNNTTQDYNTLVSSADLMIMHHGYGTLPKLLHNTVPVISFTEHPIPKKIISFHELMPLIKADAVKHFFFDGFDRTLLHGQIEDLLFDSKSIQDMISNQQKIFINGEDALLKHFYGQFE